MFFSAENNRYLQPLARFLGLKFTQNAFAVGAPPRTPLGSLQRSPRPLAGGEGAAAPSPRTLPPLSASTWPPHFEIASAATGCGHSQGVPKIFQGTYIGGALRGHLCDSTAFLFSVPM